MGQALDKKEEARKALARVKTEHLSNVELKKSEGKRFDGIINSLGNISRWEDEVENFSALACYPTGP